jgi:hypothetical protein
MRRAISAFLLAAFSDGSVQQSNDWLVHGAPYKVNLTAFSSGAEGVGGQSLSNGLLTRRFLTSPDWCTWEYTSHLEDSGPAHLLRDIRPDSYVTLDGVTYAT